MKTARNKARVTLGWAGALLALVAGMARGASVDAPEVIIHGMGLWTERTASGVIERNPVGIVDSLVGKAGTSIYFRQDFGKQEWQRLNRIQSQVIALSGFGGELVVLLKNGTWALDSPSRFSYGRQLPGEKAEDRKILAMAGDRNTLWALGKGSGGGASASATAPSTRPLVKALTTLAAMTRPGTPVLYQYMGDEWAAIDAAWPDDVKFSEGSLYSMVVLGETGSSASAPVVAIWSARGSLVQILKYSIREKAWDWVDELKVEPRPLKGVKMLNLEGRPALWIRSADEDARAGLGEIRVAQRSILIPFSGIVPGPGMVDVTIAGNVIWIALKSDGKLMQQRFDLNGKPLDAKPTPVVWTDGGTGITLEWPTVVIMVAIAMMVFFNLFRRRAAREGGREEEDEEE